MSLVYAHKLTGAADRQSVRTLESKGDIAGNREMARRILAATDGQPFGFAKLRGPGMACEGERMCAAGLVELSAAANDDPDTTVIKSVTEEGHRFLRVLSDEAAARLLECRLSSSASIAELDMEVTLL